MADKTLSLNVFARAKASGFGVVARDVQKVHGGLGKLGVLAAGLYAGNKIAGFFKESISEARESQKVNAQTAAVLKSTGGAAHVTAKQIGDLATAISNKTGIDDEQIQSSANMLLTFTNVRNELGRGNDIFNQATQVVTDMSVALGQDGKNSAIQLGKALNDPIKGITALQRVGVTFTEQQKKQITALVESGNRLGAQKIILKELTKEFGGSAAAQATAGDKLKTTWKNFQEQIGTAVLPILDKLLTFLGQKVLPAFSKLVGWVQAHWPAFARFLQAEWNNIIQPVLLAMWSFLKDRLIPAYRAVVQWVIAHWPQIVAVFKTVWANIRPTLIAFRDLLTTFWNSILKPIVQWFQRNWPVISAVAKVVFGAAVLAAKTAVAGITLQFKYWKWQIRVLAAAFGGIDRAFRNTYAAIKLTGLAVTNWFKALPGTIKGYFVTAGTWLYNAGKSIVHGLWSGITFAWGNVRDWFARRLPNFVKGVGTAALTWLTEGGKNIVKGLWAGIQALGKWIMDRIKSIIPGWIKTALGIHSPPKWAKDIGGWIAHGLAYGITHRFPHLLGNLASMARKKISETVGAASSATSDTLNMLGGASLGVTFQDPTIAKAYAERLLPSFGWAKNQIASLIALWNGESGWRWNALNPSSGAYGIPQSLPANKMAQAGADWLTNAATQIRWGLAYIKDRYGSPSNAYAAWVSRSPHWYGAGLAPTVFNRPTLIGVGERGAETVSVTPGRRGSGGVNVTVVVNAPNLVGGAGAGRVIAGELSRVVGRDVVAALKRVT